MSAIERYAGIAYANIEPAVPKLMYIFILFLLAVVGTKLIDHFTRKMKNRFGDKLQFKLVSGLAQVLFLLIIILIMLAQIGVTQDFLKLLGLVITGIIAFSSTSLITNLVSSFIIHITHPFYIGDIIKINDTLGKVVNVKSVYTEVYTFKKTTVNIPNSDFIKYKVTNYSSDGFRVAIEVSLGYDINRLDAENAMLRAAKINKLSDIFIRIKELSNSYIIYEVNGTSHEAEGLPFVESTLRKTILDEFNNNGVEIASPTLISHRKISTTIPKDKKRRAVRNKENEELMSVTKLVASTFGLKKSRMKSKKAKKNKKVKKHKK